MQYRVVEIFESIQGEGLQSGRLATFVRLAGCNLRCPWCDTPESFSLEDKEIIELPRLVEIIRKNSAGQFVVLTGGEPLLQEVAPLIRELRKLGMQVAMESNGTLPLPEKIDWLTVSPKPPLYQIDSSLLGQISELKLVVDQQLTLVKVQELWHQVGLEVPIILQPESCRREMEERIVEWLRVEPSWRLGIQLHKVLGVR